eukprot:m.187275 g.187275  ORF g.187275 m.187275 type:complete len:519 (+) comp25615_c3_seq1:192-1748(+)
MEEKDERARLYKNTEKTPETRRRQRTEAGVQLRKDKRQEMIAKRRNVDEFQDSDNHVVDCDFPTLRDIVVQGSPEDQLEALKQLRCILAQDPNKPPIQEVIDVGLVPELVTFLNPQADPQLQFEAAWILTNVSSGESSQTSVVVEAGAVKKFIKMLTDSADDQTKEQAAWALGNVAGDSSKNRDFVLDCGVVRNLNRLISETHSPSVLRNATWTLANLCRGKKPRPNFKMVSHFLPTLAHLLYNHDEDVLADACWALSYLCDGDNERIYHVIETGVCRRLVELLKSKADMVIVPALRCVGNIVTGDDQQTQVMLNAHVLPALERLLKHEKEGIRKEACWALSNVVAGNKNQIQEVLEANLLHLVLQVMVKDPFKTRKEAAWVVTNIILGGTLEHIFFLVEQGVIKPLCDMLALKELQLVKMALDSLAAILEAGQAEAQQNNAEKNECARQIDECGGLDRLEVLQLHEHPDIYERANKIMESYFESDPVQPDDLLPETNENDSQFAFPSNPNPTTNYGF